MTSDGDVARAGNPPLCDSRRHDLSLRCLPGAFHAPAARQYLSSLQEELIVGCLRAETTRFGISISKDSGGHGKIGTLRVPCGVYYLKGTSSIARGGTSIFRSAALPIQAVFAMHLNILPHLGEHSTVLTNVLEVGNRQVGKEGEHARQRREPMAD